MAKVAENLGVAVQGSDYTVVKKAGKKVKPWKSTIILKPMCYLLS